MSPRSIVCIAILILATFYSTSAGNEIVYRIDSTLEDGAILTGTFTLDTEALDQIKSPTRGSFELTDLNLFLENSTILGSDTSAIVSDGQLFQNSAFEQQGLVLNFVDELGQLSAFSSFGFSMFMGDPTQASPILTDNFVGGSIDGSGMTEVVDFDIQVVPEPCSFVMLSLLTMNGIRRKR